MVKKVTIDGNEATANVAYMFTEIAGIYPITPASPMSEHIDEWTTSRLNIFNDSVKVIEMQSEAGASGVVHGALSVGSLASTFTSSQGLLLMIPNMYKMAGEMLPCVIHVAARSLATHALSIMGDHQDVYATRATGFAIIASSSVQDTAYLSAVAHLAAIKSSIPFLHFFDGFRTSHEIQKIDIIEKEDLKPLVDYEALDRFRNHALNPLKPYTKGTSQSEDIYFQMMEVRNKFYNNAFKVVEEYMNEINKIANTNYKPFNYYGKEDANHIIIAMGSVCETIKEVIDVLNEGDYKVGLVEVHLYRPFNSEYLIKEIPFSVTNVAVLDRTKEQGSREPLYLDVKQALPHLNVVGGRYGLASKNVNPSQIKAVFDMLENPVDNFTIGITDDVTNLSLETTEFKINKSKEILIYGFGSDGMVSASKSLIKLVGDNTDKYVQGYFQYDSKKSGGITVSHLRFSDEIIRSTYYVENPSLVVITKDSYLKEFDFLQNIKEHGALIINTIKTEEELNKSINNETKKIINERHIKVFMINAYELARKLGLKNKISTIVESVIMYLINLMDYDKAKMEMKKYASDRYLKKGEEIVNANFNAIDEAVNYLKEIKIDTEETFDIEVEHDVIEYMKKRKGNELKTSAFLKRPNGTFPCGTSETEKRGISDNVSKWISQNCITCNQCSLYCPHGVIRPYLLTEKEFNLAPDKIRQRCIKQNDYYYTIGISVKDCTGCGICINNCPGKDKQKALVSNKLDDALKEGEQEIFDYLDKNITPKDIDIKTFKDTQFIKPKFCFSGACAGCGQPAYIKLLTQLFGKSLIIANATGCSSIYGASAPSMPYRVPWANSLFEDNAEYGYGILLGDLAIKNKLKDAMYDNMDNVNKDLFTKWLDNMDSYEITKEVYDNLNYDDCPEVIVKLKDYLIKRNIWTIGGDGWAYDIGFGGIDHVLSSGDDVNILVLDTQVYSNTGGQSSKASPLGSIASFTSKGKKIAKKDLARICLTYPNCYVATINIGANPMQTLKAMMEASNHKGPSILIAYTPCIAHGYDKGLECSIEYEQLATKCGYFPLFRYDPKNGLVIDSKNVDFDLYDEFLNSQTRYRMLRTVNSEQADELLKENKEEAMKRYEFYQKMENS